MKSEQIYFTAVFISILLIWTTTSLTDKPDLFYPIETYKLINCHYVLPPRGRAYKKTQNPTIRAGLCVCDIRGCHEPSEVNNFLYVINNVLENIADRWAKQ